MSETLAFSVTVILVLALVTYIGSKRKRSSRYDRNPKEISDWQKLDRGIDPSE
ncbi:MAG: hypothetical protein ACKO8C_00690 [Candidatus Nanopelagicaceae bacterium]